MEKRRYVILRCWFGFALLDGVSLSSELLSWSHLCLNQANIKLMAVGNAIATANELLPEKVNELLKASKECAKIQSLVNQQLPHSNTRVLAAVNQSLQAQEAGSAVIAEANHALKYNRSLITKKALTYANLRHLINRVSEATNDITAAGLALKNELKNKSPPSQ